MFFDDNLTHYGVKGMKWGVRRTAKRVNEARKPIDAKYKKRLKEAKTDDEREWIQMEYDAELDRIMYDD